MVLESAKALFARCDAEPEAVRVEEAAGVDLVQAVRGVRSVGANAAAATLRKDEIKEISSGGNSVI